MLVKTRVWNRHSFPGMGMYDDLLGKSHSEIPRNLEAWRVETLRKKQLVWVSNQMAQDQMSPVRIAMLVFLKSGQFFGS